METDNMTFEEWIDWAKMPCENGGNNILPEIVEYLQKHPEDFSRPTRCMEGCPYVPSPGVDPITWRSLSDDLITQFLKNTFGTCYNSILEIPGNELIRHASGIIGSEVAEKFADFMLVRREHRS